MKKVIAWAFVFFLTILLFLFYANTIYTGFFKESVAANNPDSMDALMAGMLEANLFTVLSEGTKDNYAISVSFGGAILFMAIGFAADALIFSKGVAWEKAVGGILIFVTFVFDTLLAYKVISLLKKSEVLTTNPDNIEQTMNANQSFGYWQAFSEPNFWILVVFGFLLYITTSLLYYIAQKPNESSND
jgi:hypothetical protein